MTFLARETTRFRRLGVEAGCIFAGQVATVAGMLVLVRVLTEYLEPAQYGELALGLAIAGLANQLVIGGAKAGIARFYSVAAEKDDLRGYLQASARLMAYATAAVVAIGIVLMSGLVWFGYSRWLGLTAATLIFSVLNGYNSSLNGMQNAARQRAVVAFHGGLDAWLKILFAVGALLWFGVSSTAVVLGYVLSALLVSVSQLLFLGRRIGPRLKATASADWTGRIWAYSWPFSAWGIFSWAQQVSDRWALQTFSSTQDVGLYAVVFQLGYAPIGMATAMMIAFLGPILYQRSGAADDQKRNASVHSIAWKITLGSLGITALGFAAALLLHEWLFGLLVAAEYRSASAYLPWVVLAGGVFAAGQMLSLKLMSEMKSTVMTTAKIVTALLGVCLNALGAAYFGIPGVVGGLLGFSVIFLIWMAWLARDLPNSSGFAALSS